ncbi:MAG TPA: 2'-5' RNA ligase family protein, partial [Anaerolineae bacterium]|nr:2'-5' RNA ligase family protein [Anaerolineae bacterium]
VTTDGEIFGTVTLGEPASVPVLEFDEGTWFKDHRIFPKERASWWPGATEFLVYPVQEFKPLTKPQWMTKAAPNYGPTKAPERCPTCLEYSDGFCRLHDQVVENDHTCNDWDDFEDWRGGETDAGDQGPETKAEQASPDRAQQVAPVPAKKALESEGIEDWRGGGCASSPDEIGDTPGTSGGKVKGQKESHGAGIQALDVVAAAPGVPKETDMLPFSSITVTGWGDPRLGAKAYTGAMVALFLPAKDAQALAMDLGEGSLPPEELHITLVYLGDSQELENREAAEKAVAKVAQAHQPIEGKIGGYGVFTGGEDGDVVYLSFDAKGMPAFREALAQRLAEAGFEQPGDHGFTPHITLAYLSEGQEPPVLDIENRAVTFDELTLAWGGDRSTFPLGAKEQKQEAEAMPYEKRQQGDKWCVFKEGADKPMKCYGDEDKADAYLTALRINVEAAEKAAEQTVELSVRAKAVAEELGLGEDVEAILREYLLMKANDPEDPDLDAATTEVGQITKDRGQGTGTGGEPQGDGGTSTCVCPECGKETEHERGTPCSEQECPECEVPLAGKPDSDTTGDTEPELEQKAGRRVKKPMLERVKGALRTLAEFVGWAEYEDQQEGGLDSFFKMDSDHGMTVKTIQGQPMMLTWTTNAFKDRQKEIFSTKCLEQYVLEAETKGDRGTYDLWHLPGTDFAEVQWQGVIGRFLVEAGPFMDTPLGRKAKAFFTKFPDGHPKYAPEGWGSSPEFRYLPEERKAGTYNWIWLVRRAVLPRAAAANVWTRSMEVSTMAITKQQKDLA